MAAACAAQRFALFIFVLTVLVASARFMTQSFVSPALAAGAFAMGKCGAYGRAYDYPAESAARAAALKQCRGGDCKMITMKRACAAFSIDIANPCGAHGYAVRPKIYNSLNEATRECYKFGGKDCVIRAWACDAKG